MRGFKVTVHSFFIYAAMENRENMPSVDELTQETADMVEGNEKLAEQTKHDPERGAGYKQENAELEGQLESARSVAEDHRKAIIPEENELFALELKFGKTGLNKEEQDRMGQLKESVKMRKERLGEREAKVSQLDASVGMKKRGQESLARDQELAAKHPKEHAIETVIASRHLKGEGTLTTEAQDQEAALQHRVPKELNRREMARKEAADQEKAEQLERADQEIIDSVKQQFSELKAEAEIEVGKILADANSQENKQYVQETLQQALQTSK